ncbi:MAL protein, partial [Picathartes gymnocephalus]|nr:MAL protein [Picathartes gymnocephalus]
LPMSSSTSTSSLPSGLAVLTTFPDVLFIPEIIFGGLAWILVASSRVPDSMLQGWVMFVSVFCFVMSFSLLCLYLCGAHGGGSSCWVTLVSACDKPRRLPCLPVTRRALGAGVAPCNRTLTGCCVFPSQVFAFVATLLYVIHKAFSLLRWKSS